MTSVAVEPGEVPRSSTPVELFRRALADHDVAPDGQSFVTLVLADGGDRPLTVVTSWTELRRR